jgi:hypothetical protein
MKKPIPILSFVALGFTLCMGQALATPVQPYRCMEPPYAWPAPSDLDGVVDDVYSAEQSTDWFYPDQQSGFGGPGDFTAVFRLCSDLDYLYMIAIITDDIEEDYDSAYSDPFMFDNVEFFLQLDTNTSYTAYNALTEQFRICRGYGVESHGNVDLNKWGYYMESSPTGWVVEVAIPWAAAADGGILPEGIITYLEDAIGFDFLGSDSDNSDGDPTTWNRDYQTA